MWFTNLISQAMYFCSIVTLLFLPEIVAQWNIVPSSSCAFLFRNNDYSGNKFEVKDGAVISDTTIIPEWNQTSSFRVKLGCTLSICAVGIGTTQEECHRFSKDTAELPLNWYSDTNIAHCGCTKKCNCEDVSLRQTECARAYLENDCNSCNAFYTNLQQTTKGQMKTLSMALQPKVAAIVVRPGCTLKVMNGSQVQSTISRNTLEWTEELAEYQCTCTSQSQLVLPTKSISSDLPPALEIPKSIGAINAMLNNQWKNHPGLTAALQSSANKRSTKNAYILLLGLTGSGKSTTINLLFDNSSITQVGDISSTTTDIHEYRIPVPVDELGLSNTELRIIDTPGIIDTRGMEQDAKYLATLDEYLKKHEDLKRSIPNVVLIFTKFDDNRFSGPGSNYVKMLRTINLFKDRIVDRKFSNVIFVATHMMSETKEIVRKPNERLQALKKVIEEYSLLPKPIIISLAENRPEEAELLSINGFYSLPNGEFYPKNLFDKIQLITSAGGDPIGEAIIRTAFKNSDFTSRNISQVTFPIVRSTHSKVTSYLGILSSLDRNPSQTQISQRLDVVYKNMPTENKSVADESILGSLQRIFYLHHILNFQDIPKSKIEVLEFFKDVPKHPTAIYLLQNGLNLSVPIYEPSSILGYGFDLLKDESLATSPFDLTTSQTHLTDVGFMMSALFKCELRSQINTIFRSFTSKEEYVQYRMAGLGDGSKLPFQIAEFTGKPRSGLNVIDLENEQSLNQLTAVIEYASFYLTIDKDAIQLNEEFINVVKNLAKFNATDWDSVNGWKDFCGKYGTHVVDSCYGGGSIEILVKKLHEGMNGTELDQLFTTRELLTNGISKIIDFIANLMIGKETILNTTGIKYRIHFNGGNQKYFVHNLSYPDVRSKLNSWKESLATDAIILENNDMHFIPMSAFLGKQLETDYAVKLQNAALALFNASLEYKPPSKNRALLPVGRDQTQSPTTNGDYMIMKEFASMFQSIAEQSKQTNERLVQMMIEARQESDRVAAAEEQNRREVRAQILEQEKQQYDDAVSARNPDIEQSRLLLQQRSEKEEREESVRREQDRVERLEFLQASETAAKRNQEFIMFIIENNRMAEEARQKNSFWNKLSDQIMPAVGGLVTAAAVG